MDPKSKKELSQQGSSLAQAVKWIGGAIFGDADDVLDDMAERSEEAERAVRRARRVQQKTPPRRIAKPAPPPPEVIDVEGFVEDEDDE